jgi:hypothetical protein
MLLQSSWHKIILTSLSILADWRDGHPRISSVLCGPTAKGLHYRFIHSVISNCACNLVVLQCGDEAAED